MGGLKDFIKYKKRGLYSFFYIVFYDIIHGMKNRIFAFLLSVVCLPALAAMDEYENTITPFSTDVETPTYVDDTGIDWFVFSSGYYQLDESSKSRATGLNPGDWRVFYQDQYQVLGTSTCNESNSDGVFTAAQKQGPHCWCKVIATTNNIRKTTPTKWAYRGEFRNISECANLCTYRCSYNFLGDPDFRGEIFNK